jgi:peptidyl-prolyl cis-trans isomerase A (cyclophilin A)
LLSQLERTEQKMRVERLLRRAFRYAGALALLTISTVSMHSASAGTLVSISTNFGNVQVDLFDEVTPTTVNNFVSLISGGTYTNTIIHRSVSDFVIQGGGFKTNFSDAPNNGNIPLEYKILNTRGTIAMARSALPNSANSQFFISTDDNSVTLAPRPDDPNVSGNQASDGYAAFGWVVSGMEVIDAIAALNKYNFGSPFDELPLKDYTAGNTVTDANKVIVNSISIVNNSHPSYQNPLMNVDTNNDGRLNSADAMVIINDIVAANGSHAASAQFISNRYWYFDPNGDGRVNTRDIMAIVNALIERESSAAPLVAPLTAVPEPSSIALLISAGLATGAYAFRRRARRAS